jgi:hypothetical protein
MSRFQLDVESSTPSAHVCAIRWKCVQAAMVDVMHATVTSAGVVS